MQLFGEVWNLRVSRAKVYFELRDADGALPCSMWRNDFDALRARRAARSPTARRSSSAAGWTTTSAAARRRRRSRSRSAALRVAGEGDLLAQLDRLRKTLDAEGLFAPQKLLARPALPRTIGVVTGEGGKARDDVLAGLRAARLGRAHRVGVRAGPGPPRRAADHAPRCRTSRRPAQVDVIVVARGGGSLADLFCFCDETLCRTVALLGVPVIASVGHHTDRTLIDDVAALSCSTPTHAAESAVPVHCAGAPSRADGRRLGVHGARRCVARRGRRRGAAAERPRRAARCCTARRRSRGCRARPASTSPRERARLHQRLREIRASGRRRVERRARAHRARSALVLDRKAHAGGARRARRDASCRRSRWRSPRTTPSARSSAATRS